MKNPKPRAHPRFPHSLFPHLLALTALALLFSVSLLSSTANAHQPRIVNANAGAGEPVVVSNPEVSQAFYGVFNGAPATFVLESDKSFTLFVQVLVPDLPSAPKDVSAIVYRVANSGEREKITVLDAAAANWSAYYEEYAGDYYYEGESARVSAKPGKYEVVASRPGDYGKFVLAIGWKEDFSAGDWLDSALLLPRLKQDFFEKPAYDAFFNLIGVYLLCVALIVGGLIALVYSGVKTRRH